MIRVLGDRVYAPDAATRKRLLTPESVAHPAKCNLTLVRDLVLRYTRPGQTILDPFGGVGSTLLACLHGRNVVLVELEEKFVGMARANWARLSRGVLPGLTMGWADMRQGDSRRLPLPDAGYSGVVGSPPFGSMNAPDCGGTIKLRPAKDGSGFDGDRSNYLYSEDTPGQIGNLPLGDVAAVVGSPPYVDARQQWPTPAGAENIRYGTTPGQIGGLAGGDIAAVVGSPPYSDVCSRNRSEEAYAAAHPQLADEYGRGPDSPNRSVDGYGQSDGQIGALPPENYCSAVLQCYREAWRVTQPGGVLVLVTGNYVRGGNLVDLAKDTITLCAAAGWTPVERWRACKTQVSFWRRLHHQQRPDVPVVAHEDVLVCCKGTAPAWAFAELPPTTRAPVDLQAAASPKAAQLDGQQAALPLLTPEWATGVGQAPHQGEAD